ncbi:ribosome small subunit-dependent GTPase A [Streptomyces lonarensis]|uniref:Small ribosomal subunit biogenesis GTPase RsgA n=1 Tax=Streptomyces lonarensis TaxID=700599 RepID=A0A7X6D2C1_9ACTN|nr:ribosome small subunit-dependent GTPase A [Streptomyces lonarensis]NJQ06728.1 ribosome small subunit-dependent GTPase A [Streptomyces lonarensis]
MLRRIGWDDAFAGAFRPYHATDPRVVPGRIARVDRGGCELLTADGPVRAGFTGRPATDPTERACTGDWAVVGPTADGGREIRALLPRRSAFLRSGSSKSARGHVLAANVDISLIAVSLADELVVSRLERFVALAWAAGTRPVVVLTKGDLASDVAHLAADAQAAAPGAGVHAVSALTGDGVDRLAAQLRGASTVLLGLSGAGKSTLANALTGRESQRVQSTRGRDGRGRHTTTTRDLLPLPEGGVLLDTPGLRGVGLWQAAEGVGATFGEIEQLAQGCRFGDCGHRAEPGCAVLAAIEDGSVPQRRLDSYRKLLRENERLAARADVLLRAEQLKEWKRRAAQGRWESDVKRGRAPGSGGRGSRRR